MGTSVDRPNARNDYFDVLKGIGIVCVLWGHSAFWGTLPSRLIFSFHMPLFFVVSGMFFSDRAYVDRKILLRKVLLNLILPYFIFYFISFLLRFDVMISRWQENPLEMLASFGRGEGAMWFLLCLSAIQILSGELLRRTPSVRTVSGVILLCLCLACCITKWCPHQLVSYTPFSLWSVPSGIAFFLAGYVLKRPLMKMSTTTSMVWPFFLLSCGTFVAIGMVVTRTLDLHNAYFRPDVVPLTLFGLIVAILFAKLLMKVCLLRGVVSTIGRNSVCFFSLEAAVWYVICRFVFEAPAYGSGMWLMKHTLWMDLFRVGVMTVVLYIISFPCVKLVKLTKNIFQG